MAGVILGAGANLAADAIRRVQVGEPAVTFTGAGIVTTVAALAAAYGGFLAVAAWIIDTNPPTAEPTTLAQVQELSTHAMDARCRPVRRGLRRRGPGNSRRDHLDAADQSPLPRR